MGAFVLHAARTPPGPSSERAARAGFVHMGVAADLLAAVAGVARRECDAYALRSHRRSAAARDAGRFAGSLVPVRDGGGDVVLDHDEAIRDDTTLESLAALEP